MGLQVILIAISGTQAQGKALKERSNLDYATVYNGVFDPNNIAIHVAQNFVNFAAGTVAWFLFAAAWQNPTLISRTFFKGRSLPSSASDLSQFLRSTADSIDSIERALSMTRDTINRLNNIE